MGHIVNPIVYRLSKTKFWKNSWMYFIKKNYRLLLLEDLNFDKFVNWFIHSIDWFSFQTQIFKSKIIRFSKCFFLNIFFLKDSYSPYTVFEDEVDFVPTNSSIFFKFFLRRHVYRFNKRFSRYFLLRQRFKMDNIEDLDYIKFYKKKRRRKVILKQIFKIKTFFDIEWWKKRARRLRKFYKIFQNRRRLLFSHNLKSIKFMSIARSLKYSNRRIMFFFRDRSRDFYWFRWRRFNKFYLLYLLHRYQRRHLHSKTKYLYNIYAHFFTLSIFRYQKLFFKNNFKVLFKPWMSLSTKLNLRRGAFTHYDHLDFNTNSFFNYFRNFLSYFLKKIFHFRIFKINLIRLSKFYHETSYLRKLVRMRVYQGFRVPHYLKKLYWKLRKKKKLVVGMKICLAGRYMKRLRNRKIRLDFGSFKPSNINTPISHTNFIILLKQGICGIRFTLLLKTKLNEIAEKTTLNLEAYK